MSDRAVKYGFLFVALNVAGFLLFELLKSLRIHPVQYLSVGLAPFFLLLLSLSERIAFGPAYAIAAGACIALQGFYLNHLLGGTMRGIAFAGLLGALFGALYGLLVSEDMALLMGSALLFGLLALAMVITRRPDWYALRPSDLTLDLDRAEPAPRGRIG
jgi:inner membrane protein